MELSQKIIDSFAPTRERIKKAVAQQTEHVTLEQARAQVNKVKQNKTGFSYDQYDGMTFHASEEAAKAYTEKIIEEYRFKKELEEQTIDLPDIAVKLIADNFEELIL